MIATMLANGIQPSEIDAMPWHTMQFYCDCINAIDKARSAASRGG